MERQANYASDRSPLFEPRYDDGAISAKDELLPEKKKDCRFTKAPILMNT
jgi:hypothetical protein